MSLFSEQVGEWTLNLKSDLGGKGPVVEAWLSSALLGRELTYGGSGLMDFSADAASSNGLQKPIWGESDLRLVIVNEIVTLVTDWGNGLES